MKSQNKLLTLLFLALAPTWLSFGATLTTRTPVHLQPDASSPTIATLPAGSSVVALLPEELRAEEIGELPQGWIAIRHPGPYYGYAPNASVGKDLSLKPGSVIRAEPSDSAPLLTMIGEDESAELVEIVGDWSRVVFSKEMIGFIRPSGAGASTEADIAPAETSPAPEQEQEVAAPEAAPRTVVPPATQGSENVVDATPRVFQGYLMRTRRVLGVGPKLDYQLVDESGRRIALLDLSRLLVTDPLDRYENRQVNVFGPVIRNPEVKDMIIRVETLRLGQ